MHIAEGFLPPLHAAAWTLASAPFVVAGVRELVRKSRGEKGGEERLWLAASGSFVFLLSALKLPSLTGSSSHATGVGFAATLAGIRTTFVTCLLVLLFQALLLAHGGLSTLGANFFSMGVVGGLSAWAVLRLCERLGLGWRASIFAAAVLSDLLTYVTTAIQLALAYPDASSGYAGSLGKFLAVFAVTQVPLALAEGFVSMALMEVMRSHLPADLLGRLGRNWRSE